MRRLRQSGLIVLFGAAGLASTRAQWGAATPVKTGPKLSPPQAFPPPGDFPTTESVTLLPPEPGVSVHYTFDGSLPTETSPTYNPLDVLFVTGFYEGEKGVQAHYTIRAVAIADGHQDSDPATFQYTISRRDRDSYVVEELRTGVRMIRDSDNDKMFLVVGAKRCVLIDTGMGHGRLKEQVKKFTKGRPLDVLLTHNHPDHIGQVNEFLADTRAYIADADRPGAVRYLKHLGVPDALLAQNLLPLRDGDRFDLGDRVLTVYATPGHTPGSVVILDEKTGDLFTGDSFGSNSPTIPDALWLQWTQTPLDEYLAVVKRARFETRGRVKAILTGHNDHPLLGDAYLDHLEGALQQLMDQGDDCLVPSYRPAGLQQVVIGNRMTDPNWVAINVNKQKYLPAPVNKIAGLVFLNADEGPLDQVFSPSTHDYSMTIRPGVDTLHLTAIATSSRYGALTVNGTRAKSGEPLAIPLEGSPGTLAIAVTSHDGTQHATYFLTLTRG